MIEGHSITPTFTAPFVPDHGLLVIGCSSQGGLSDYGVQLDQLLNGTIRRTLKSTAFIGHYGETVEISTPEGVGPDRVLCVGLGSVLNKTSDLERLGGRIMGRAKGQRLASIYIALHDTVFGWNQNNALAHLAFGLCLKSYSFDRYRLDKPEQVILSVSLFCEKPELSRQYFTPLYSEVRGILLTRELTTLPPSDLTPTMLAEHTLKLKALGIKVTVIQADQLISQGFAAVHAVGRGSAFPPCVAIMEWTGSSNSAPTIGLAGKGVTFDAGGLTLKPASQQPFMKYDMGGAAAVIGALYAIAEQQVDISVIGLIGLAENLPGPEAYKTGDVLKMQTGLSVEVTYPDAEGRLILADLLAYLVEYCQLDAIVDVATLTGTVVAAIGSGRTGLFSNDDELVERFQIAAITSDEAVWRLPLDDSFLADISSHIADVKNMPTPNAMGILAGSASVAAAFLNQFTGDIPYVHLDIAGAAWSSQEYDLGSVGPTGASARLLTHFLKASQPSPSGVRNR